MGGINTSGQIAGRYTDASNTTHGFLRDVDGSYITLDEPDGSDTWAEGINDAGAALGINDAGQIVGENLVPGMVHGFLLDVDGRYTPIDVPGAIDTLAWGINNAGLIVGSWGI